MNENVVILAVAVKAGHIHVQGQGTRKTIDQNHQPTTVERAKARGIGFCALY